MSDIATLEGLFIALTAIVYGVAVFNCLHVLQSRVSPGATMAWILVNIGLPFVGIPLYVLFGNYRIRGYVKRHRQVSEEVFHATNRAPATQMLPEDIHPMVNTFQTIFTKFNEASAPLPGDLDLLIDGHKTFQTIFETISEARHYILVQYYILRSDRLGRELKDLLIYKARQGIPVYLLYDDMGSFWLSRKYINDLVAAGIKVARFLPIANFKRLLQINFRNHRKLVVVDGLFAFTGGLNVGEEYVSRRYLTKRREGKYWRDTHVRLNGPSVNVLEDIFAEDWHFATGEKIRISRPRSDPLPHRQHRQFIQVIPTGPTDQDLVAVLLMMQLIQAAQKRLWIATPYFVPDAVLIRALELSALRGVDVKILLPKDSDYRIVQWVSLFYAELIATKGVDVCLYHRGFMHQKIILIDDAMTAIGTMNFDNRALYLNFETMLLIHGRQLNREVEHMMQQDFLHSTFYAADGPSLMRGLKRLRANTARLLAPLM